MLASSGHLYDFGPFRLDLKTRMLSRDGAYVPLTPKAFQTLAVLIENNGRIVDKEELLRRVWPGTFIEEATLAKTVSILRKVLGEGDGHHYIDTVPKRGYRFAIDVRIGDSWDVEPGIQETALIAAESSAAAPPAGIFPADLPRIATPTSPVTSPSVSPGPAVFRWLWLSVAVVFVSVVVVYALEFSRTRSSADFTPLKAVPLTSFPGRQNQVAFSPDGNQIAFIWDGADGGPSHVYVKVIGSEALLQLTHGPGADSRPAWSPDGRSISFLRSGKEGRSWYLTSVLGGPERRIAGIFPYFNLGNANTSYFAPDGKTLAIVNKETAAEPSSIFLVAVDGSARRRLTSPPPELRATTIPLSPQTENIWRLRAPAVSRPLISSSCN